MAIQERWVHPKRPMIEQKKAVVERQGIDPIWAVNMLDALMSDVEDLHTELQEIKERLDPVLEF